MSKKYENNKIIGGKNKQYFNINKNKIDNKK